MKKYRRRSVLSLLVVSLFFSLINCAPVYCETAVVRNVVDGDTIELSDGRMVRYIGIDAPETHKNTPAGWVEVHEPFGAEAKKYNEELVKGKSVRLELSPRKEDKYKRTLAYCFVKSGGREVFVQEELLRQGLVYLYTAPPDIKYVDAMARALTEAKERRAGIWSLDQAIDPKEASRFLGERKLIKGYVMRARSTAKVIRLTLDGLVIVIFKKDLELFKKNSIDPAKFYRKKNIRVYGLIKEYQGATEVIISNPWQIEVV